MTAIVAINSGSSSVKYALYGANDLLLLRGQMASFPDTPVLIEKVPTPSTTSLDGVADIASAVRFIAERCAEFVDLEEIGAVGHRVVHGGASFSQPTLLDHEAIRQIEALSPLAPSHQPSALAGIEAATTAFPSAMQTASFDTSFHRSQDSVSQLYALPRHILDKGIRRYGFHGLSYKFTAMEMAALLADIDTPRIIAAHLGSGASLCAMRGTESVATSMGFTALDGLPMATRCGNIDPGVLLYLLETDELSVEALSEMLYQQSGLKGLSGISGDMPALLEIQAPYAREAIDYFVHRIVLGIGEMAAALGGIDALVFSGGIGENAPHIREMVISQLAWLGFELDSEANAANAAAISTAQSKRSVHIVKTDEEVIIAREARSLLR